MSGSAFVVIVNYCTDRLVIDCLRSLASEMACLAGGRVIVVDNAFGDGSAAHIAGAIRSHGWNDWAEVIELPRNGRFAYRNNRAINRAAEHAPAFGAIVCLNPDTVVRPGALAALPRHFASNPAAGIAETLCPFVPMKSPLLGACARPTTFGVAGNR